MPSRARWLRALLTVVPFAGQSHEIEHLAIIPPVHLGVEAKMQHRLRKEWEFEKLDEVLYSGHGIGDMDFPPRRILNESDSLRRF